MGEILAESLLPEIRDLAGHAQCSCRAAAVTALSRLGSRTDVPVLARRLGDPCPEVRAAACLALASVGEAEDVSRVLGARLELTTETPLVRGAAAVALGLAGDRPSVPTLARLLSDRSGNRDIRTACATALGLFDDARGAAALTALAGNGREDAAIRAICVSALGRQGLLENAASFAKWLGDDRTEVRRAAARALGRVAYRSAAQTRLEAARDRHQAWLMDGSLSPAARKQLEETIADSAARAKAEAARVGKLRRSAVRALRQRAEKDRDLQIRAFAVLSLGEIGGSEGTLVIRGILDRKTHPLKPWACLAAGLLGDRALVPAVRAALGRTRDNASHRGAAAIALGLLRDQGAGDLLATVADDDAEAADLRGYAMLGLAMTGDRSAPRRLAGWVRAGEPAPLLRSGVIALGIAGRSDSSAVLMGFLRGRVDPEVRSAAVIGLRYLRSPDSARALASLLQSGSDSFRTRLLATVAAGHVAGTREADRLPASLAWGHAYRLDLPLLDLIAAWL